MTGVAGAQDGTAVVILNANAESYDDGNDRVFRSFAKSAQEERVVCG